MQKNKGVGVLRIILGILLLAVLMCAAVWVYNQQVNKHFRESFYRTGSAKIEDNLRIIQISDLHSSQFGSGNSDLLERVSVLKPDIIVMTGDSIEEANGDMSVTLALCEQLVAIAPVYYVYGNHETKAVYGSTDMSLEEIDQITGGSKGSRSSEVFRGMKDSLRDALENAGVKVLLNEADTIEVGGNVIDVYGILTGDPYAFWEYAGPTYSPFLDENEDHFKLLLSHVPYVFETWDGGQWADLTLAGHTHGGMIRIPGIGGLFEHRHGLLPEYGSSDHYIYGEYNVNGSPLIISSGLSGSDMLRINNPPELVVVDVSRY